VEAVASTRTRTRASGAPPRAPTLRSTRGHAPAQSAVTGRVICGPNATAVRHRHEEATSPRLLAAFGVLGACDAETDSEPGGFQPSFEDEPARAYPLGLPTLLEIAGWYERETGDFAAAVDGECLDDSCVLTKNPLPLRVAFTVVPKTSPFRVRLRTRAEAGRPALEATLARNAVPVPLALLGRTCVDGLAVLTDAVCTFRLTATSGIPANLQMWSWADVLAQSLGEAELLRVPLGHFEDEGDDRLFVARGPGAVELSVRLGTFESAARVHLVDDAMVRDVALAPFEPQSATKDRVIAGSTSTVRIKVCKTSTFWVTFTTEDGTVGLGGAGDATPDADAAFALEVAAADPRAGAWWQGATSPPAERDPRRLGAFRRATTLALRGTRPGRSTLKLRVGPAVRRVTVDVTS